MINSTVTDSNRFIPESARWLLGRGRTEEAKQLIGKVAKINKGNVPELLLEKVVTPAVVTLTHTVTQQKI